MRITKARWFYSLTLVALSLVIAPAQAGVIEVSQESAPGAGDFLANPLGYIDSFSFAGSTADFYNYGGFSYNAVNPPAVSNTLQYFFLESTDGLAFIQVVDSVTDGSGGFAVTRTTFFGDLVSILVADDANNVSLGDGGATLNGVFFWRPCCTDGAAVGPLETPWGVLTQIFPNSQNVNQLQAVSASGGTIVLDSTPYRRILFRPVPEPGSLSLLAGALLIGGFALRRRRQGNA